MTQPKCLAFPLPLVSILKTPSQHTQTGQSLQIEKNTQSSIVVNREPEVISCDPYQYTEEDEREEFLEQLSILRYEVSENPNNLAAKELLDSLEAQLNSDQSLPSNPRPIDGLNVNEIREPIRPFSPTSPRGWMEVDELDSLRNRPHDSQEVVGDTSTSVNAESESHTDPNVTPPTLFANNSPQRSALHTPPHSPQSHQRTTRNQEFSHIGFISPAFVAKTRSSIQSHNFPNETHSNHSAIDLPHRTPKILQEGHSLHDFPVKTDTKSSLTPNSLKQKPIRTRNAPGLHVDVDPESTDDIPVPSTLPPTATAHSVPPQYAPRIQSPKNSDNVELNDDDDELDSLDLETLEVSKMIGKIHESLKDLSKHASQNLSDSLRQLETDTSSSPRPASQYTPNLQNSQTPNMNMVDVNQSKPLLSSNTSKKTLRTPPPHRKEEITPKSSKTPSRIPKLSKRAGNDKSEKFTASNVVVFKLNDDEVGPDKPLETPQRIVKIPKINEKAQKSSTNLVNDSGTSPRISVDTPTKTGRPPLSPSDPKHISPHPTKPTPFVPRTPPSTYRELFRQTKELRQKVEETTNPPFLRTVVLTRLTDDEKRELAKFEEEKRMEEEKRIEEETARRLAEEERRKSNTKTAGTPQRHSVAKRQPARQTQSISPSIKRH